MKINYTAILLSILLFILFSSFNFKSSASFQDEPAGKNNRKAKVLKICVISDLNSSYGSTSYSDDVKAVISQLDLIKPDIILCAGDMVAGQKASLSEENINAMWDSFKTTVLDPVRKLNIPFGFTVGNHDASPTYLTDRKLSQKFWKDNIEATGLDFVDSSHYPFYYSYIKNNVFFISWDAAGAKIDPEVYDWMKKQLNEKLAKKASLRILIGHLPLYAIVDSKNKAGEVNSDPEAALSFFNKNGIDLYISGHQHAFYPAVKDGIRFLNAGCIGDGPRKLIGNTTEAVKTYTLIEVPKRKPEKFSYKTYIPNTKAEIDLKSLPDSIIGFNGISIKEKY
ncbi:Calcineurin-like phosphoesterase [Daejeonella rubra]|uniref:Calcineurin-like phosphoesterase n=1 Tax=Daejeonella rubra TaxID=990371 RepID=A0A1G9X879_9SPHI|nr:metallophosphoesterase [Daejeonella rubra]SDM92533.1 Calcineurin-like phosphoesterase [Daejeonella rubra]